MSFIFLLWNQPFLKGRSTVERLEPVQISKDTRLKGMDILLDQFNLSKTPVKAKTLSY